MSFEVFSCSVFLAVSVQVLESPLERMSLKYFLAVSVQVLESPLERMSFEVFSCSVCPSQVLESADFKCFKCVHEDDAITLEVCNP